MNLTRLERLQNFLKDQPEDEFILFAIAKEYENLGDEEQAKKHYIHLTDKHPNYVGTYYHLGKLYEQSEDFELAIVTYQKGMEVAKSIGDGHAFGELRGAYDLISDE